MNRSRVVAIAVVFFAAVPTFGQTAGMLSFQGLIRDAQGDPVEGSVTLEFRIFDAETLGNLVDMDGDGVVEDIIGEDVKQVVGVSVAGGVVSTKFGPVSPKAFDGNERWLQVSVDGEALSRVELANAPAIAEQLNTPGSGTPAATTNETGNVGIGTTSPTSRLEVLAAPPSIGAGVIASSPENMTISGEGTAFTTQLHVGDTLIADDPQPQKRMIVAIASDEELTVQTPFDPELPAQLFFFQQPVARLANDGGGTALIVDALGNVGIGTGTPGAQLDVNGAIRSGNSITIDGIADTISSTGALDLNVSGNRALRLEPSGNEALPDSPNVIGGFSGNSVAPGIGGATIAGGGFPAEDPNFPNQIIVNGDFGTIGGGLSNIVSAPAGTVSGGSSNSALGDHATVSGGFVNTASGFQSIVAGGFGNIANAIRATIGGGNQNIASGQESFLGGGQTNVASGMLATVGGGQSNIASGVRATVPGGLFNSAVGGSSFAAGRNAKANHDGAFVWSSSGPDFASTAVGQFNIRAHGGTRIFSNGAATVGVQLVPGGNSWSALSDRNFKENLEQTSGRRVLEKLRNMPVPTWNLISQDPSIRHIGPMAQDFYAAFGLGESQRYISSSDADGVAFAAIKGLHQIVDDQRDQIAIQRTEMTAQRATIADLTARLDRIEKALTGN